MSRRGTTLVELALAIALLGALLTAYFLVMSGGNRESAQLERGNELMGTALLLHEALAWDLLRSVSVGVLGDETRPGDPAASTLRLPVATGYDGRTSPCFGYRPIAYAFDPATGTLTRDGQVLAAGGLHSVTFRWLPGRPPLLEVALVGRSALGTQGPRFVVRLPAPSSDGGLPGWRFAPHHRGARAAKPAR